MADLHDQIRLFVNRDDEVLASPWQLFDDIRASDTGPVYSEDMGAWIVTRRHQLYDVIRDPETWSNRSPTRTATSGSALSDHAAAIAQEPDMADVLAAVAARQRGHVLENADPPEHVRQRRALHRGFRPKRLRGLEPDVEKVSDQLVAAFAGRGHADLVREYTILLPMIMISRMLGVPEDEIEMFKAWSDDFAIPIGRANPSRDEVRSYFHSEYEFERYFSKMIQERQADPRDDLISDVANAEVDGEPLTHEVRISALVQFLLAGNETTTTLLSNIGRRLATDHDVRDRLAADRTLVPAFVEEALRYEAPVMGLFRQANRDAEIDGFPIAEGDSVWLAFAAANRDSAGCPVPHDFDIDRDPNDHLAFGHGEHYCIGQGLARLEAKVGTNALLDLPNLTLAESHRDCYADSYILRGLTSLEVTFDPIHAGADR